MDKISMSKEDFIKEHKKLSNLDIMSKAQLKKESKEQSDELEEVEEGKNHEKKESKEFKRGEAEEHKESLAKRINRIIK
jgi:hypothetical protein